MNNYILAIDQGTTSTRAIIYDHSGKTIGKNQKAIKQIYPKPGWVEHNPEEIWETTIGVINGVLKSTNISAGNISAIGITNQRETTVVWDKKTGKPIHNAIVWQCRRTSKICNQLKKRGLEEKFKSKTGLVLDPYFSGTKVKWILDNVDGARKKAEKGDLLFGTIDSWLIWNLTGGEVHVTDYTNASRTLLFNIHDLEWDKELLDILEIPEQILPEVRSSSEIYGRTAEKYFNGQKIPVAGVAGDQQAATFAQCCFEKGMTKITYGTGAFMIMNTGEKPVISDHGLLTTIAWGIDDKVVYALEGSIFMAGAIIEWLINELNLISDVKEFDRITEKVNDTDGVYVVPALTGLGAPYWSPEARGTIVGLSRGSNKGHIVRACLESMVYRSEDLKQVMYQDSGIELKELRVDGGVTINNQLIQLLADITEIPVQRPDDLETTAAGSAYLAGLAVGYWDGLDDICSARNVDISIKSTMSEEKRKELYKGWKKAVKTAVEWGKMEDE